MTNKSPTLSADALGLVIFHSRVIVAQNLVRLPQPNVVVDLARVAARVRLFWVEAIQAEVTLT